MVNCIKYGSTYANAHAGEERLHAPGHACCAIDRNHHHMTFHSLTLLFMSAGDLEIPWKREDHFFNPAAVSNVLVRKLKLLGTKTQTWGHHLRYNSVA